MLRAPAEVMYADEIDSPRRGRQAREAARLEDVAAGGAHLHLRRQGGQARRSRPSTSAIQRLVEIAISTLVTDRALLLIGEPGTAKSWLSEHLAAAINGDSTKVVQGTAGTTEEQIRYTWNYAMLIAHGPSHEALIKSPIFRAMESGTLARFEEITRCAVGSAGRDDLAAVGEADLRAGAGDRGAGRRRASRSSPRPTPATAASTTCRRPSSGGSTSSCCRRPATLETEIDIVRKRVRELAASLELRAEVPADEAIEKVVTIFRELRTGQTLDGKNKLKTPSGVLSTAEAISVLANSMALAGNFGTRRGDGPRPRRRPARLGRQGRGEGPRRLAGVPVERAEEARRRVAAAVHRLLGAQRVDRGAAMRAGDPRLRRPAPVADGGLAPAPLPRPASSPRSC